MNIGAIVENKQMLEDIQALFPDPFLFSKVGEFSGTIMEEHMISAGRVQLDSLFISLEAIEEERPFHRQLKNYRIQRPDTQIFVIGIDRIVGDPTITGIVSMGIYDIICPSTDDLPEDEELDITFYISERWKSPATYADAARWHVSYQTEENETPKKTDEQDAEKESQVIFRDRFLDTIVIAVGSVERRTGNTYTAIQIASFLAQSKFKVACIEHVDLSLNTPVFHLLDTVEDSECVPGGFHSSGIDFFTINHIEERYNLFSSEYDYIVLDIGTIFDNQKEIRTQYFEELLRSRIQVITSGSSLWDYKNLVNTLNKFIEYKWSKPWNVLINYASQSVYKEIEKSFSQKEKDLLRIKFFNHAFIEDPLKVDEVCYSIYKELLKSVLPVDREKKKWNFKWLS